jgi:hypothetical protein
MDMQIRFHCPTDLCVALIEYEPLEHSGGAIPCPRCQRTHRLSITDSMRKEDSVDRCAVCGCSELFLRKDFPQRIGVLVVMVFGLLALYYFRLSIVKAWLILAAAAVIDLLIYAFIGRVTTCYACRAEYRQCRLYPAHANFDLATSEKY